MSGQTQYAWRPAWHALWMRSTTSARRSGREHDGADGHATRRQLVDHRYVEVGIGRHRQRPRDGGRRHDQLVRHLFAVPALLLELHALLHAEAVLLVNDHQRQAVERHALLEQRMCAHGDLHLAAAHGGDGAAPCARRL